jgi:hypothetical protein
MVERAPQIRNRRDRSGTALEEVAKDHDTRRYV